MESFAGLQQMLMVWQASECFVEVDARICGVPSQNPNIDTEQQSTTTTSLEGYQTTPCDTAERHVCSLLVICTGMKSYRDQMMKKSDDFIVNLGGRRPPRRVKAYSSTNNHELDNTNIDTRHDVYLAGFNG